MKIQYIFFIVTFFLSCSSLKYQENQRIEDTKEIAKIFFETQYKNSKKINYPKDGDFVYISISNSKNFDKLFNDSKRLTHIIKDEKIRQELFNLKAIEFYKTQKPYDDITSIEKYVVSDKVKLKPEIDTTREYIKGYVYFMNMPVFSKDGKYAIFYCGAEENYIGISIYKKENGVWKSYRGFAIGFS